jgi:hypothetical protein
VPDSCVFPPPFAAILPFDARAGRLPGGIADVVPIAPGDMAPGGGGYCSPGFGGKLERGEEGPGPPGGVPVGPVEVEAPAPGPVRCADAGATIASAAIIATPLRRYFMSLILCCSSGQATKLPTAEAGYRCTNGATHHSVPVARII